VKYRIKLRQIALAVVGATFALGLAKSTSAQASVTTRMDRVKKELDKQLGETIQNASRPENLLAVWGNNWGNLWNNWDNWQNWNNWQNWGNFGNWLNF
jgi:hypothetical protein